MSLVNDMLRDLDRRGRPDQKQGRVNAVFSRSEPPRRRTGMLVLIVIAAAGIALGLVAAWLYARRAPDLPSLDFPVASFDAAPAASPAPEPSPALVRVNVVERPGGFALAAFFTERLNYELLQQDHKVLSVLIPRATVVEGYEKTDLEGLDVIETSAGLSINVVDEEGVEFSVGVNNESPLPSLMISMDRPARPAPSTSAPSPVGESMPKAHAFPATLTLPGSARALAGDPAPPSSPAAPSSAGLGEGTSGGAVPASSAASKPAEGRRVPSFDERDREAGRRAAALAQRGEVAEALRDLLAFVSANPEAHHSREILVTLLIGRQDLERAHALLAEGLALAPADSGFRKLQARLYLREGEVQEALALLGRQAPPLEEDVEYHDLLATLLQQAGDHAAAVSAYQSLLRADPSQGRWWTAMAISHEALGNSREAMASYQAALRIPGLDPRLKQYGQERLNSLRLRQ